MSKLPIKIYMSSTDFNSQNDLYTDWSWKKFLKNSLPDTEEYSFIFHDPLECISDDASIVEDDIFHMTNSNFVVAYLPHTKLTIGTIMEIQHSCIFKPSHCVVLIDRYRVHRKHPWIKYWVKNIVDDEVEAAKYIMNTLSNKNLKYFKEVL